MFAKLIAFVAAVATVSSSPLNATDVVDVSARSGTPSSTGTDGGYYYSWYVGAHFLSYNRGLIRPQVDGRRW